MTEPAVAVIGTHQTPAGGEVSDRLLEEMVFEAASGALVDAGLTIDDVDAVVISSADQAHGRVIESMVTAGASGAVGRDLTTVASAGEHALVYAYLRLRAGHGRRILTVTWGKPSEAKDPRHVERMGSEPFLLRPLGMDATAAAGLQASAYVARFGVDPEAVAAVRVARWRAAGVEVPAERGDGVVAWPLTAADLPRPCDIAAAAVLAAGEGVDERRPAAWMHGVGWSSEAYDLGSRDLSELTALRRAAARACPDGLGPVDVVEVQEISTFGGFAALEALGVASPGKGVEAALGERPAVNPSGGNLPADAGNAAGYLTLLAAARHVRGHATRPGTRTAIGAALHGFAGQGAVVVRFGSTREVD